MKTKFLTLAILAFGLVAQSSARAEVNLFALGLESVRLDALDGYLIDWKVGDSANYDITGGPFGKMGTMTKAVTKEEGETLWLKQELNLMSQHEVIEIQLNRTDGTILKIIRNGKEEKIPDDKLEIISQEYVDVTVPAGTFKSLHIIGKTKQIKSLELWANPQDTCMEGTLKQIVDASLIKMTFVLTSFNKIP